MNFDKAAEDVASGIAKQVPWIRIVLVLVGVAAALYGAYKLYQRIAGDPVEVQRKVEGVTKTIEQGQAQAVTKVIVQRVEYRTEKLREIEHTVEQGQQEVDHAWDGESVGDDVDAAGAAALCRVHDSLCRRPGADEVQRACAPEHDCGDPARAPADQ